MKQQQKKSRAELLEENIDLKNKLTSKEKELNDVFNNLKRNQSKALQDFEKLKLLFKFKEEELKNTQDDLKDIRADLKGTNARLLDILQMLAEEEKKTISLKKELNDKQKIINEKNNQINQVTEKFDYTFQKLESSKIECYKQKQEMEMVKGVFNKFKIVFMDLVNGLGDEVQEGFLHSFKEIDTCMKILGSNIDDILAIDN